MVNKVAVSVCKKDQDLSWNNIENKIEKETAWLRDNIAVLPDRFRGNHTVINCGNCLFRKIASLIVGGQIKARELKLNDENIWLKVADTDNSNEKRHGKEWHQKIMNDLNRYFRNRGYKIEMEPSLNYGRADLGVKEYGKFLFIEVGTVSPFKLWFNLVTMKKTTFLIVPTERKLIEFTT
jgi:hypothetical protein